MGMKNNAMMVRRGNYGVIITLHLVAITMAGAALLFRDVRSTIIVILFILVLSLLVQVFLYRLKPGLYDNKVKEAGN